MTEAEWLADDPKHLLWMFRRVDSPHDRKQRLAVIAILHVLATRFPGPKVDRLLSAYEDLADHRDRDRFLAELGGLSPYGDDLDDGDAVFRGAIKAGVRGFGNGRDCRVDEIRLAPGHAACTLNLPYEGPDHRREAVAVVRDVFGNPFRPVAVDPSWLTPAVVSLARRMDDARDFAPMPRLGDALREAGCDALDLLAHCRGDGPHVRGCWALDLVLGRE